MNTNDRIRVALCDDQQILREGINQIIEGNDMMEVVIDSSDGESLLSQLSVTEADVAVLDITSSKPNGVDILSQLQHHHSQLPVLMLSIYPEDEIALLALKAGADGHFYKGNTSENLIHAIRTVYEGKQYVSDQVMAQYQTFMANKTDGAPHNHLSKREYEVLLALGRGYTIKEISFTLSLSEKTVSTYKVRLFTKMGFTSTIDLATYLRDHQLLDGMDSGL